MKATKPVLHFFAGLTLGTVLFVVHLFVIAYNLHGKPTGSTWSNMQFALVWPVVFAFLGLHFSWNKPIIWKTSWLLAMALALTLLLALCACVVLFMLIAYAGYC